MKKITGNREVSGVEQAARAVRARVRRLEMDIDHLKRIAKFVRRITREANRGYSSKATTVKV